MIREWLFPWESPVMIEHPLAMPIFMIFFSLLLSILTWVRQRKGNKKN